MIIMNKNTEYQPLGVHDGPFDPPHQPHIQGHGGGERWKTIVVFNENIVLRELHSYFSGAEEPFLSKSVCLFVRNIEHLTKPSLSSLNKGKQTI